MTLSRFIYIWYIDHYLKTIGYIDIDIDADININTDTDIDT
jgi:hypothetical protein